MEGLLMLGDIRHFSWDPFQLLWSNNLTGGSSQC